MPVLAAHRGTTSKQHVPLYEVLVNGSPLSKEEADHVRDIRVVSCLGVPDVCTVSLGYPKPKKPGDAFAIDSQPFNMGAELEVKLGAREERQASTLFRGVVTTLEPEFGSGGIELGVRAFDKAHRLHQVRKVRTFRNQTASDMVAKICREAGLNVSTDPSGEPYPFMQQDNETDWDFIWRLADRVGFEFVYLDPTAYFRKPKAGAPVELEWPRPLLSYRARVTSIQQFASVTVRSLDPMTKEVIEGTASRAELVSEASLTRNQVRQAAGSGVDADVLVATEPLFTKGHANALAQALLDRMANNYYTAEGQTAGDPRIKAGTTVRIKGVGKVWGGVARVSQSTHRLSGGSEYSTSFTSAWSHSLMTLLNASAKDVDTQIPTQVVLGQVTSNADPDDMGRVKVTCPALGRKHESDWARVAVPSGGAERGLMMLPVKGEEVLVAFEHNDTTRPYVIGSLFNGKDKPGEELAAKDGSFGLRSDKKLIARAKEDIELTGDKTYLLKVASDATETFQAKLTTTVAKDAKLEVTQGSLTITSFGDITIKNSGPAANINIEATGQLSLKGNMGATLDGSVQTAVKGAMIQIG